MNTLFTLSVAALIGALAQSALAAEAPDTPCPMQQGKHAHAASMPHAMKHKHHGAHDMHGKTCPTACKATPAQTSQASQPSEASVPHDAAHAH